MVSARSYRLICPIARALDRIGDRWTLLILRDLHAGPARFSELQTGLTGIAANLLTDRLSQLVEDDLVEKVDGEHGVVLYRLTETGEKTRTILFELALFGGQFPVDEKPKQPGNPRALVVTLREACQRAVKPEMDFTAELSVDGQRVSLSVNKGEVCMANGKALSPDVLLAAPYDAMMAALGEDDGLQNLIDGQVEVVVHTPGKEKEFMELMAGAVELLRAGG